MKEKFEKQLKALNEISKIDTRTTGEKEHILDPLAEKKVLQELNDLPIGDRSKRHIYRSQIKKRNIMRSLKEELKKLDDPAYQPEKLNHQYKVVMEDEKFFVTNDRQDKVELTKGEILTDGDWEMDYFLDPDTVPRSLRKKYLIKRSKSFIELNLNEQLSRIGAGGAGSTNYLHLLENLNKDPESRAISMGTVAEIMVKNFFEKLVYDHGLDLEIVQADAEQDSLSKIDFIIKRRDYHRGVDVETSVQKGAVGIQFTLQKADTLRHKKEQINELKTDILSREKLDDVVVVSIPGEIVARCFNEWMDNGRRPGGPDKLMTTGDKEIIFNSLVQGILTEEEIKKRWAEISIELK